LCYGSDEGASCPVVQRSPLSVRGLTMV
jgi:hypothetical protein